MINTFYGRGRHDEEGAPRVRNYYTRLGGKKKKKERENYRRRRHQREIVLYGPRRTALTRD